MGIRLDSHQDDKEYDDLVFWQTGTRRGRNKFDIVSSYLNKIISANLKKYPVNLILRTKDSSGALFPVHSPSSLLAAMWFQLFLALTCSINIRRCSICGEWEDMKNHRSDWSKHSTCANKKRIKRWREKTQTKQQPQY